MAKFKKPFNSLKYTGQDFSNSMVPEYVKKYDENGAPYLEKVGEHDLQIEINSHFESTDLVTLLARYTAGEKDIFKDAKGQYIDVTNVGNDLISQTAALNKANADLRSSYQNFEFKDSISFNEYFNAVISGDYSAIKKVIAAKKEESHE